MGRWGGINVFLYDILSIEFKCALAYYTSCRIKLFMQKSNAFSFSGGILKALEFSESAIQ